MANGVAETSVLVKKRFKENNVAVFWCWLCILMSSLRYWFPNPGVTILDDLSKCCKSTSKEMSMTALNCWKIWIENQQVDDWKQNEVCYCAVRPFLTNKFHPLHKDCEIIEVKLSLMWLTLHKVQFLMNLEGPQHILEVFIQSCLSWLSFAEEIDVSLQDLILKLLSSLLSKNVKIVKNNFPPLKSAILFSNKLFCRFITSLMEIFQHWGKIRDKTDLLFIWIHFLEYCEQFCKFIPTAVWHKIFKLVEIICSDENEAFENKIAIIHSCAISLKSVMYSSKYIDGYKLLTTPADALLKIVLELSGNSKEDNHAFQIFKHCKEICKILSSQIIHAYGFESCIYILSKIEEIESRNLLWGLWCGLTECFREQVKNSAVEKYCTVELKLFRKLRSVAINLDLDRRLLDQKAILWINDQLKFLRMGNIWNQCPYCTVNYGSDQGLKSFSNFSADNVNHVSPYHSEIELSGSLGFNCTSFDTTQSKYLRCMTCLSKSFKTYRHSKEIINLSTPKQDNRRLSVSCACPKLERKTERRWLNCNNYIQKNFQLTFLFWYDTIKSERPIINEKLWSIKPLFMTFILEQLCKNTRIMRHSIGESFIEHMKQLQLKMNESPSFIPFKVFVLFSGIRAVEFCEHAVKFWDLIDEIIYDIDFKKNLNSTLKKNDTSLLFLCMFLFLVNFTQNLIFESINSVSKTNKKIIATEICLSKKTLDFMENVISYKERVSTSVFLGNVMDLLPMKTKNPLVMFAEKGDNLQSHLQDKGPYSEDFVKNLVKLFNSAEELQNKIVAEEQMLKMKEEAYDIKDNISSTTVKKSKNSDFRRIPVIIEKSNSKVWVVKGDQSLFRSFTFLTKDAAFHQCEEGDTSEKGTDSPDANLRNLKTDGSIMPHNLFDNDLKTVAHKKRKRESPEDKDCNKVLIQSVEHKSGENECIAEQLTRYTYKKAKENIPLTTSSEEICPLTQRMILRPRKLRVAKLCTNALCQKKGPEKKVKKNVNDMLQIDQNEPSIGLKCKIKGICDKTSDSRSKSVIEHVPEICHIRSTQTINEFSLKSMSVKKKLSKESCSGLDLQISRSKEYQMKEITESLEGINTLNNSEEIPHKINDVMETAGIQSDAEKINHFKACKDNDKTNLNGEDENYKFLASFSSPSKVTARTSIKRRSEITERDPILKKWKLESEENDEFSETLEKPTLLDIEKDCNGVVETIKKEAVEGESVVNMMVQKSPVQMIRGRGSRMIALVSESPKIEHFKDSSPPSKQHKLPNMTYNSRASRMLALLPELQENNVESNPVEEINIEKAQSAKGDGLGKGISANPLVKVHHSLPNAVNISTITESPKRRLLRQKRSIGFDEDRNETVTYFTDSPPCFIIQEGVRFRGTDKQ